MSTRTACPTSGLRAELVRDPGAAGRSGGGGVPQRVERLLVLTGAPALDAGEITDKGYVNQRAVRERRAAEVAMLSAEPRPSRVVVR